MHQSSLRQLRNLATAFTERTVPFSGPSEANQPRRLTNPRQALRFHSWTAGGTNRIAHFHTQSPQSHASLPLGCHCGASSLLQPNEREKNGLNRRTTEENPQAASHSARHHPWNPGHPNQIENSLFPHIYTWKNRLRPKPQYGALIRQKKNFRKDFPNMNFFVLCFMFYVLCISLCTITGLCLLLSRVYNFQIMDPRHELISESTLTLVGLLFQANSIFYW